MRSAVAVLLVSLCVALVGCSADPSTPEYWEKRLSNAKGAKGKTRAVEDLRASKHMSAAMLPMLRKALDNEKSGEVKGAVARVLGEQKDAEAVDALIGAVDWAASDRPEKEMNVEIARALGTIGDKKAVPTLMKMVASKDNFTAIEGIEALGALRATEGVEPLIELAGADTTENFVIKKCAIALGNIGDPKAIPLLTRLMFKEKKGVSFYMESSFALYQIGTPAADSLLNVLDGKDKALAEWASKNNIKDVALPMKAAQVLGDLHDLRAEKALIGLLNYKSEFDDIRLLVRMRGADALGRSRSKEGGKVLIAMLDEPEPTARHEYIWALIRIGTHDAVPKLVEGATKGIWDAREESMVGLAMLGNGEEGAAFDRFSAAEGKVFGEECKEDPEYAPCKDLPASVKKHQERIAGLKKSVEAAKECKKDAACWAKKLDDADLGVRGRAAYEIGRSGNAALIGELLKRTGEKNLDARVAFFQGADWLVHDSKDAMKAAQEFVPALEKQIAEERGKTEFIKVNEDLKRLLVKIKRG